MRNLGFGSKLAVIGLFALCASACDDDKKPEGAAPAASKPAAAPAPTPAPPPPPKPLANRDDCPDGSVGPGTFSKPCEGKGDSRMMEVTWTGKMGDGGPSFRVVNTSKAPILFGKMAVYFYDKDKKQIGSKAKTCSGDIFDGPMKPGEKAVITFSCVKKDDVPADAKSIQAEMETVGFTDADGKKNDFYWTNKDIAPDTRPMDDGKGKKKKK